MLAIVVLETDVDSKSRTLNKFHSDKPILSYSTKVISLSLCFLLSNELIVVGDIRYNK